MTLKNRIRNIFSIGIVALAFASCSSPKDIVYFQDVEQGSEIYTAVANKILVQPKDQLRIIVSTSDPRLTDQFNLSIGSTGNYQVFGDRRDGLGYTVDSKGNIDFPVLGELHVEGLTREQVADLVKSRLQAEDLVKDPVVIVQYMNLNVSVLGEVRNPGRVDISKDKITVLDAIAAAGDLTLTGMRENVMIIRNAGPDNQEVYEINLTDANDVYSSPAFYLQQDDVVYVAPNDKARRNSTANGNTVQTYGFWMSLATVLMSLCVLIFK